MLPKNSLSCYCIVLYHFVWSCTVLYGLTKVNYGPCWSCMVVYGFLSKRKFIMQVHKPNTESPRINEQQQQEQQKQYFIPDPIFTTVLMESVWEQ